MLDELKRQALCHAHAIALDPVVCPPLTYAALAGEVESLSARLRAGNEAGRPVALALDHGVDEALLELAALAAGLPVLSIPGFFTAEQRLHALASCGAQAIFAEGAGQVAERSRCAPVELPPGTARITFTSGSTGTPKGVCLSAGHMLAVARSVVEVLGSEHAGRHLALLPPGILLETVAGFFATLFAGGTYVCPPQALVGLAIPSVPISRPCWRASPNGGSPR